MSRREFKGKSNLGRCVLCLDRNVDRDDKLRVYGGGGVPGS